MYIWASLEAQLVKNSPAMQKTLVWFLGQDDSLERDGLPTPVFLGFPDGLDGKEFACNAGDLHSIPALGKSPGRGHGNPLQYSCLENPHGQREPAGYSPWGCKQSDMTERLSTEQHICIHTTICIYNFNMYGKVKLKMLVSQSSLTLFDPMDCSPPGSYILGIPQARILERVAIPFSRRSSQPRDWTWASCIAGRFFTIWATREVCIIYIIYLQ